jgi:hypothetical protein
MVFLSAISLGAQTKKTITIDHIGEQDMPFALVIINTEREEIYVDDLFRIRAYCKVDEQTFEEIKSFIQTSRFIIRERHATRREYGYFEIVIEEADGRSSYYVPSWEHSLRFFYSFIEKFSGRENLVKLVEVVQTRYFRRLLYGH